ncbi:AMP-binding protein [Aeromicrobium panaciterrae]|uniref:AMP-binding protein n=1 Tax=Aeromicrobium panaciterrae TaxID=363861 RepID=UPI0031DE34A7
MSSYLGDLGRLGDAPALLSEDGNLSYAQLAAAADAAAASWGSGRHLVLIACVSSVDTVVAQVAALRNDHPVIMAPASDPALVAHLTDVYQPDVVVTPDGTTLRGNPPPMHPDLGVLLLTSGSTGSSKLVRLRHRAVEANTDAIAEYLELTPADRAITSLPVFYGYGLSILTSHLAAGASIVLTDYSVTDPCFWELAERHRVTSISGVPYTFELIEQAGGFELPDSVRYVTMSGGHSPPERVSRWVEIGKERGFVVFSMYGATEATSRMTYVPPAMVEAAPDAIGVAIPGGQIRLDPVTDVDEPGVGEIVYRGDNVMMGYAERASDLALGSLVDELHSGDLARLGDDGLYRWMGRRSRIAKVFGLRIDLVHVEKALASRGIKAACVDAEPGITVFAISGEHVLDAVSDITGLPRHAIAVRSIDRMPMTTVGKPDHGRLRQLAQEAVVVPKAVKQRRSPEEAVRHAYALVLHRPDATAADTFTSLSGDSLSYVELSVRLGDLGVDTSPGWQHRTIAELAGTTRARASWSMLDSTIILRAVAIILIVMNHTHVYVLTGTAHVLLGVAGYNFARFQRSESSRTKLWRSRWRSLLTVMAPAMAWIIAVTVLFGAYDYRSILLSSGFTGFTDDYARRLWFAEDYFWIQVFVILLLAVPYVDRLQRRNQLLLASTVLVLTCVMRLAYTGWHADFWQHHEYDIPAIAWCFAIGWVAALLKGHAGRLALSVVAAASTFGFFQDLSREIVLLVGLMVVIWVPLIPVPRFVIRPLGLIAGATLFIFVSHFQTTPGLIDVNPWFALVVGIVFGVVLERAWSYAVGLVRSRTTPTSTPVPPTANAGTPASG